MVCSSLDVTDIARLRCPRCRGALGLEDPALFAGRIEAGRLVCAAGHAWPVERGLARLFEPAEVRGNDRLLNVIYDRLAALHDPAATVLLPLFGTGTERAMRARYIPRLELEALAPPPDGGPARILEIGIGTGGNVPWVRDGVPAGLEYELWGVDLAEGMLARCARRLVGAPGPRVRLAMADAHALPFADHSFDRVFHVGATNNYRDPDRALSEMARVAKPDTPIVVVDERLDPRAPQSLYHRAAYRLVTFYESTPRDPVSLVPDGAVGIRDEQLARFFYCLTFRMPAEGAVMPARSTS